MNSHLRDHLFWGVHSPLTALGGMVLLVTASGRIAFALVCTLALVWVAVFTMTALKLGEKYLPERGRGAVMLFVSALGAEVFLFLLWIFNPILALESAFIVFMTPVVFTASDLPRRVLVYDMLEVLSQALAEALVLGVLVLGLALVREPLGYGSVSVPGFDIIRFIREEPLRILQASPGVLIILGYVIAVYRYFRNQYNNSEDD